MAVNLSPVGGVAAQFFTSTGAVLTGGKLYTYSAGTTTPAPTYTSSQGVTAWSNPIVLDAAGRVSGSGEIWLTDGINYKFVLKDSNDVLIATYDNITGINSNSVAYTNQQQIITATAGQTVFNLSISYQVATNSLSVFVDGVNQYGPGAQYAYTETSSTSVTFTNGLHAGAVVKFTTTQQQGAGAVDSSQVTYDPPYTNSVATNVEDKLAEWISVFDFGAVGDGVTDDGPAFNAALLAASTSGMPAVLAPKPPVKYLLNTTIVERDNVALWYSLSDVSVSSTKSPATGKQLIATQGSTYPYYKMALNLTQQVPLNNGALPHPYRYWTVYGGVDVPSGATVVPNSIYEDHVAVVGYATNASANTRIWGFNGVAVSTQTATSDVEMGLAYGGEFDVNNETGRDVSTVDVEFVGVQTASGGSYLATAGLNVSSLGPTVAATALVANRVYRIVSVGTTDFTLVGSPSNTIGQTFVPTGPATGTGTAQPGGYLAGAVFKEYSTRVYGLYFHNVAPLNGAVYLSDLYSGGAAVNVKNDVDAVYMRNAGSTNHVGRIGATATQIKIVSGPSGGVIYAHSGTGTPLAEWTNNGNYSFNSYGAKKQTVSTSGTITALSVVGAGIIDLPNATTINNLTAGVHVGQEVVLYLTNAAGCTVRHNNSTGGVRMVLAGSANFVATQFSNITLFYDGVSWVEKSRTAI